MPFVRGEPCFRSSIANGDITKTRIENFDNGGGLVLEALIPAKKIE
jgi:hypothetical protein